MRIRFPLQAAMRDGRSAIIRPFTPEDTEALFEFFQGLPQEVRRFAWDRIDSWELVKAWGEELDHDKAVPLLALDGKKVVGDATIHYREGGPLRRVARVKWLLDPAWRGVGLGRTLIDCFIQMARHNGMRHLTCMLIKDLEVNAIETLRTLGFDSYTIPGYGTDPDGSQHDMVMMILRL